MDDVVSQGMDREPKRLPRLLGTLAITCCLVVAVALHVRDDGKSTVRRPVQPAARAILAVGPVQLAGLGASAASLLDGPAGITSQAMIHYPGPSPIRWWQSPGKRLSRACR